MSDSNSYPELRNVIADSPLSQEQIDKQSALQDESMTYVYSWSGYQSRLAELQKEIKKIDQLKAALREQEDYVTRLNRELTEEYEEIQDNNNEIAMCIDPKTGKSVRLFPDKKPTKKHPKVKAKQEIRRIIGYAGADIVDGKLVHGFPIYANNNDDVKQKKTSKHNLENGIWTD